MNSGEKKLLFFTLHFLVWGVGVLIKGVFTTRNSDRDHNINECNKLMEQLSIVSRIPTITIGYQ
jgi:hypothetical protein